MAGEAMALLPESAGRALRPDGIVVAWRSGNRSPAVARFLDFVRAT